MNREIENKERLLRAFLKKAADSFPLRHTFEVKVSDKSLDQTDIPQNGSLLCISQSQVDYYYVPYQDYGVPKYYCRHIESLSDFVDGPLKNELLSPNLAHDIIDQPELPVDLERAALRLRELKADMKASAQHDLRMLAGSDREASQSDLLNNLLDRVESGDYSTFDTHLSRSSEYSRFVDSIRPIVASHYNEKLKLFAESELAKEVDEVVFGSKNHA